MGHNVASWEMIRTREEKSNFDGTDGTEVQHTIMNMNNMVDARACYKPSGKVSVEFKHEIKTHLKRGNFDQILINPTSGIDFSRRKISYYATRR